MRHIHPVLVSLGLLSFSLAPAAAQNVCVHAADGAIVCGPVAPENKSSANPFDQPQPSVAQPTIPSSPTAAPPPAPPPSRVVRQTHRDAPPPKHAYRQPPPREFDRRPPPSRRVAREDVRRLQAERDHRPPPRRVDREPPMRFSDIARRPHDRPRDRMAMRDVPPRQYENRLRELEREVHALRAERDQALRHIADRRPPPRELRRDERDRYGPPPRPPRNAARDRYSNDD